MARDILEIIDEQHIVAFTGKINFLSIETSQLVGSIMFIEGKIINAQFGDVSPLKSLLSLLIKAKLTNSYKVVVEPELISEKYIKLDMPISVLRKKIEATIDEYSITNELRPSDELILSIDPSFIKYGEDVSSEEYSLLCTLSDYGKVSDLYTYSNLLDHEITNMLVKLRKKNAINVVNKGINNENPNS